MTLPFKSRGTLAGERLCPNRARRPLAASSVLYLASSFVGAAIAITPLARWIDRARAVISGGIGIAAPGRITRSLPLPASERRAIRIPAENRKVEPACECRTIVVIPEQRNKTAGGAAADARRSLVA
jgi:hypothetical protein